MRHGWSILLLMLLLALPGSSLAQFKVKSGEKVQTFGLKPLCVPDGERPKFVFVDDFIGATAKRPAKILWVAFFASWCEPCKKELPRLNEFYKQFKGRGLQVLVVNIDKDPEEIAKAREIVKGIGPEFIVLSDKMQIVVRRYFDTEKSISLPANLVVDAEGTILSTLAGADQENLTAMEVLVRDKIGAPPIEKGKRGLLFLDSNDERNVTPPKKLKKKQRKARRKAHRKSAKWN